MFKGHRATLLLLLMVLAVRPHMAGGAYPFSQGLILAPALVGLALLLLDPTQGKGGLRCPTTVWLLPWTLWFWSLIGLFRAPDPGQGVRESVALLGSVTVFTVVCRLTNRQKEVGGNWVPILGLVVVPVLASATYQRLFGLGRIREALAELEASGQHVADLALIITNNRVFAGFLNPNMLAGFLAIGICITLDLLLTATDDRKQFLFFSFLTGGQVVVLIFTGSVGGSMAAVAMAGCVLLVRREFRLRETVITGLVVLVIGAGILAIRGGDFLFGPESSLVQRAAYMAAGMRMAMVHPILGWGAGSAPGALMGFVAEGIRPVADPHNFVIRAWISWGLPGLLLLGSFLVFWFRLVLRPFVALGRAGIPAGYAGFVFGSVAFLGHSLMDMDFFVPETALFGWAALGAAAGMASVSSGSVEESRKLPDSRISLITGGAVLVLVLPVFVYLQGESLAFRAGKAMAAMEYEMAARLFREARALLPMNGRFALDEGRARLASGEVSSAADLFEVAQSLMKASPYPSWEQGRAAQQANQWQRSILPLEKALERYGTSPRIRIDLARAYLELGKDDKGFSLLEDARRLSYFDPQARELADDVLLKRER